MADINALVESTRKKKHKDIGWHRAADQAVRGKGITHKPDVDRLVRQIVERIFAEEGEHRKAGAR